MKLFGWVQNKFSGGQGSKKTKPVSATHHTKQEPPQEEFNDWPQGLLTIGTFGNHELKDNPESHDQELSQDEDHNKNNPSPSSDDLSDFTAEEVGQLQKELKKLLRKKSTSKTEGEAAAAADLPLDRFLNCPSSLEVDRRLSTTVLDLEPSGEKDEDIDQTIRVIIDRCKDVFMEKNKKSIGKKSVSFLLKKMFVCRSGFSPVPTPSLRDTFQETRMEKLLRTMLTKKIYPQNCSRASSMKRYIEDKQTPKTNKEDEANDKKTDGSKWVKTDSEFIVLEI